MKKRPKNEEVTYDYNEAQKKAIEEKAKAKDQLDEKNGQEWVKQQLAILRKGVFVDVEGVDGVEATRGMLTVKLVMIHDVNGITGYNTVGLRMSTKILSRLVSELQKVQAQSVKEEQDEWRKDGD